MRVISILDLPNDIRIPENNDWVIILLVCCAFLYVFMMISLHRDSNIMTFLRQEFSDSSNKLVSWLIVSLVTCLTLSALISQYIPIVPKFVSDIRPFGYQLNKFGFTFLSIVLFYLIKAVFSFLFYQSVGISKKWQLFYFTNTRFYFVLSLLLMMMCIAHYYFPIDKGKALFYYLSFFGFVFIFKIFYSLFHKNMILPNEWYYKFLYICTLQIIPLLTLWKLLFF